MWKTLQRNKKTLTSLSKSSGLPAHAAAGRPNRPATAARRDTIGPHFKAVEVCRSWTVSRTIARMAPSTQFSTEAISRVRPSDETRAHAEQRASWRVGFAREVVALGFLARD